MHVSTPVVRALALAPLLITATQHVRAAEGADFPSKPIRLIVPQAPGGSNDIMARYFGAQVGERIGKQIVVDNRPGAEGMIGTDMVAKANPDGYTLLMASAAFTMNPAVYTKLPYDPVKDFDWVGMLGSAPVVVCVSASLPVKNVQELIAYGKAQPKGLTIASAGGFMHFVSAMFRSRAGIPSEVVLYRGGAPAIVDVMSGQAHIAVATIVTAGPQLRAGKLKPLATGSSQRSAALPDVPTLAEAGVPNYEASIWWGWASRAGTPQSVLNRLSNEIVAIQKQPETIKRFAAEGAEVIVRTPADMRNLIPADIEKWKKVAIEANMPRN
jgi:tripartite-type tricarboxylate transporter receptor subunit TctC